MRTFKEFGIKPASKSFIGDKIKIDRIINREIVVLDYKVEDSKYNKGNGKCLYLQIELQGTRHVVFIGSTVLMEMIQQVPAEEFPFATTIVRENHRFEFT